MKCSICGRELIFKRGIGWVHEEFDSLYILKCKTCGHEWGERKVALRCPKCGSDDIVDDRCAMPDYSGS